MSSARIRKSAGFTLVETLIALAITLLMMGAVVQIFGIMGDNVAGNRASVEMSERLRATRDKLQSDLGGITAPMLPPLRPEANQGYFEAGEGFMNDHYSLQSGDPNVPIGYLDYSTVATNVYAANGVDIRYGDLDDYLAMTVRSRGEPFVGRYTTVAALGNQRPGGVNIESPVAEVIWYLRETLPATNPRSCTLYRRVLPIVARVPDTATLTYNQYVSNHELYDLSVYAVGGALQLNTLGDLTRRDRRSGRTAAAPWRFDPSTFVPFSPNSGRMGEDVVLTNVLAFDVQLYDPTAPIYLSDDGSTPLEPRDMGYSAARNKNGINNIFTRGAFVDLGYAQSGTPQSIFSGLPNAKSGLKYVVNNPLVYDTYSMHYEAGGPGMDGFDRDGNGATNGLVDDDTERVNPPPYASPLRGLRVKIRIYEPDTRQVREVTVVQDFLPE